MYRLTKSRMVKSALRMFVGVLFVPGCAFVASAQLNSASRNITITATAAESISIVINSGATVSFALPGVGASSAGSAAASWTTSWVLASGRTSVKVYAYFLSATALTGTNPSNTISANSFQGQANGGSATVFSGGAIAAVNTGGAGMLVSNTAITGANLSSSKTDTLALTLLGPVQNIDIFPADTYTGVLNIQAQATP